MICHNARITKKAIENARIEQMEQNATPLLIVIAVVLAALLIGGAVDTYQSYTGKEATAKAFASCLNGQGVDTGYGVITCKVGKELVK